MITADKLHRHCTALTEVRARRDHTKEGERGEGQYPQVTRCVYLIFVMRGLKPDICVRRLVMGNVSLPRKSVSVN